MVMGNDAKTRVLYTLCSCFPAKPVSRTLLKNLTTGGRDLHFPCVALALMFQLHNHPFTHLDHFLHYYYCFCFFFGIYDTFCMYQVLTPTLESQLLKIASETIDMDWSSNNIVSHDRDIHAYVAQQT